MEFDFTVAVRKGRTHVLTDHMSRIPNGEKPIGVEDDLPNAPLFLVDLIPEWAKEICHYITNGLPTDAPIDMGKSRRLIRDAAPYQLNVGQLYKQGKDGVLRRCVREDEFILILDEAHSRIAGGHFVAETTACKVLQAGL